MAVETTTAFSGPYTANGATTTFGFTFIAKAADEIGVLLRDSDGVDSVVSTSAYTVTLNANGTGSVVFATAPATGNSVYIYSDVSFQHSIDFEDGTGWKASPVNEVSDRAALRDVYLKDKVDRGLVVPVGETGFTLPAAANRASKFLAFDTDGDALAAVGELDTVPVGAFGATLAANATAADARSDLGINSAAELAAASGSSLLGFEQSGTGSLARTVQGKLRDFVSLSDKGTTADALTALQDASADFAAGGSLHIPKATWSLSGTWTFTGDRINVEGDGRLTSIIQFDPASADVAFEINKSGAGGSFQGSIKNLGFYSTNTVAKTAIRVYNQANYTISDIAMSESGWQGDSIGIQSLGRQSLHVHNCEIACARPIVISPNPEWPTLSSDHFLYEHLELIGTSATRPVIEIEDGVVMSNLTFRNLAIVKGKDGVLWEDTTTTGVSYSLLFENIRTEQGLDSAAYSFRIGSTAQNLQSVTFRNIYLELGRNGIRLRKAQNIILDSVVFAQTSGTALDIEFVPGTVLVMQNCRFQNGSTITLTNAKRAFSSRLGASQSQRGAFEVWVYEDPADMGDPKTGANVLGGILTSADITIANGATYDLVTNEFTGRVQIDSSVGTGADFYAAGTNNVTALINDPYSQYSVTQGTASRTNFYWDAGSSRYRIENNTGSSKTYTVIMRGRAI